MKAQILKKIAQVETNPLSYEEIEKGEPGPGEIRIKVLACGLCLTDKHIIEGDIPLKVSPIIPGHQIVGVVDKIGDGIRSLNPGSIVGVPWLHSTCNHCQYCSSHRENLCDQATFTGYDTFGGFAEYTIAVADYVVPLDERCDPVKIAPLLCAGIVGFRSYKLSNIQPGQKLGLFGFGGSAHLTIQVAKHFDVEVEVYTRSENHKKLALEFGASLAEDSGAAKGRNLDAAIIFAPAGELIPIGLSSLKKGGTLAINAIHTSNIPLMPYNLIYGERVLRSVANATREDAIEFLALATKLDIQTKVTTYPLEKLNDALKDLKASKIDGSCVITP